MNIHLHKNARATPAIRQELQAQLPSASNRELAEAYGLNRHTVAKWRQRGGRKMPRTFIRRKGVPCYYRFAEIAARSGGRAVAIVAAYATGAYI